MGEQTPPNDPKDLIARLSTPISINGLRKALKSIKERWGSNVRVVPVPGAIEFRYGGVPNKGRNPHGGPYTHNE